MKVALTCSNGLEVLAAIFLNEELAKRMKWNERHFFAFLLPCYGTFSLQRSSHAHTEKSEAYRCCRKKLIIFGIPEQSSTERSPKTTPVTRSLVVISNPSEDFTVTSTHARH